MIESLCFRFNLAIYAGSPPLLCIGLTQQGILEPESFSIYKISKLPEDTVLVAGKQARDNSQMHKR